jgi:hypothetical protein
MKCLRIYASPDGESHFGEVEIPTAKRSVLPHSAPFELSAHYPASRIRFTRIPAGMRQGVGTQCLTACSRCGSTALSNTRRVMESSGTFLPGVCASYSAAIRSPLKHLAIRSPTPLSMLRQYSKARASTGSVTPFLRWPTTLETKRSRSASFMTLRTRVPG